jgi:LPXTG-site transpeptidase (sortase) family protein
MRQLVKTQQQKRRRRNGRRMDMRGLALTSLATILFVFGIAVGVMQLHANREVKAQAETLAAQAATANSDGSLPDNGLPSEDPPSGGGYWRPAPDEPKRIKIPSLGVDARILKMGVMPNGEIKTPANIFDAGWLETTAKPGEYGAMFLDGHVHGPSKPGVFYNIKKLQPGDKIKIERGDGQIFTYSVVKTETYSKDNVDMVAALNTAVPGKPGLNLMTCDGRYSAEHGYDHRVVVFAVLD